MSDTYNPNLLPVYLEASSKDKLIKLMLLNNEVNASSFNYQTPAQEGSKWVVWFYADLNRHNIPKEKHLNNKLLTKDGIK